ncbi:hypothetical protein NL676_023859 [Syzygium grande]|nr:hypothetical protein NL676_023859 [Syzygium grande]
MAIMAIFFFLSTPVGVAIGTGISAVSVRTVSTDQMALIIQGMFSSASAGILIYMAVVDLSAADFTSPRSQSNLKLQMGAQFCLAFGAAWMSLLVRWA